MKYIPSLIPKHSKITPDGWLDTMAGKNASVSKSGFSIITTFLLNILAALFFLFGIVGIFQSFFAGVCFLLIGVILLPVGAAVIEKMVGVRFSWLGKSAAIIILFAIAGSQLPSSNDQKGIPLDTEEKKASEKLIKETHEKNEKVRLDSLNHYVDKAKLKYQRSPKAAIIILGTALKFATKEKNEIIHTRATWNYKINRFKEALADYSTLIENHYNISDTYCERGACLNKLKRKQEAVADLKLALNYSNPRAQKLYDQINPIKKRVSYYVTRCCDGSTSNATGRGACSHHGGVCDWSEPVYEEYREY